MMRFYYSTDDALLRKVFTDNYDLRDCFILNFMELGNERYVLSN